MLMVPRTVSTVICPLGIPMVLIGVDVDLGVLKIELMKPAKHAIARPRRGQAMACFADTNLGFAHSRRFYVQRAHGTIARLHGLNCIRFTGLGERNLAARVANTA
jgi:hypothetical protein